MKLGVVVALFAAVLSLSACQSRGPQYQNAGSFSEGLAPVQANNGRWGYVNANKNWVISPRFEDAKEFKGGQAAVKMNGKWGYINKNGDWR